MRRYLLIAAGALVAVVIGAQFVIPAIAENRIESRLTEGGGTADVSVSALPAERLLFGDGHRLDVSASDLQLELSGDSDVFSKLDGFDAVHVAVGDSNVGPFEVQDFSLDRDGSGTYHLTSSSSVTGAELVRYGASQIGVPGAGLLGAIADQLPQATEPIPIELDMQIESDGGVIRVVSGGGTVAGYPTGPLAELLTAAIAVRL